MILWFFVVVFIKGVNFKLGFLVNKYKNMFINCYIFLYDIDIRDLLDFYNYLVFFSIYDLK